MTNYFENGKVAQVENQAIGRLKVLDVIEKVNTFKINLKFGRLDLKIIGLYG